MGCSNHMWGVFFNDRLALVICRHVTYKFCWDWNKLSKVSLNSLEGFEGGCKPTSLAGKSFDWFQAFRPLKHAFWDHYIWIIRTRLLHNLLQWMIKDKNHSSRKSLKSTKPKNLLCLEMWHVHHPLDFLNNMP